MHRRKIRITLIYLNCIEKWYYCGYWTMNRFIVAINTFQNEANVLNVHTCR